VGWTKGLELAKLGRRSDGQEFNCATLLHKAKILSNEEFQREVENELTGKDSEPHELIYFNLYKSQIPVIGQAIETAANDAARDVWRCQFCGSMTNLEVHHQQFRSHSGDDTEANLITLCTDSSGTDFEICFFQFLPENGQAFVRLLNRRRSKQTRCADWDSSQFSGTYTQTHHAGLAQARVSRRIQLE